MFRRFLLCLSLISLAACALTIACSSSSNSTTTNCSGGPYNPVGDWQLSVTPSGGNTLSFYGAIDTTGLALFFETSLSSGGIGDSVQLPSITGSCSFTGSISAYAEPGSVPPGGTTIITYSATGNLSSSTSLSGSFSGNSTGSFSAASFSPLTNTVAAITGQKTGQAEGAINSQPILTSLTFSATGTGDSMSFTSGSTNPDCTLTGTFTQVGTANVFDVSMTFTSTANTSGCAMAGTFTGIGFESSSDYFGFNGNNSADTYLYADILAESNTFVMEVY